MRFRILALSHARWDSPWVNRQQLLSRLGRRHAVLYSHGGWVIWERTSEEWRRAPWFGSFEASDGLLVDRPPKLIQRWPTRRAFDELAIRLTALRWRRKLARLGSGPSIAYLFDPWFYPYVNHLRADSLVYHAYDDYRKMPGWNSRLERWQRLLVQASSTTIASSRATAQYLQGLGGREVHFLPNGVDYEAFASGGAGKMPDDLAAIPPPRIGYAGRINRKVDLDLIADIAHRRPDWQLVVIGEIFGLDDATSAALARCRASANIHLLGHREAAALPAYVAHMDVNLMSYRVDAGLWTEGIYPLKLHEYLAAGPPVVSADLPSVREFADVVDIVRARGEWEARISAAIAGRGAGMPESRRAVARRNTWSDRVEALDQLLQTAARGRGETAS